MAISEPSQPVSIGTEGNPPPSDQFQPADGNEDGDTNDLPADSHISPAASISYWSGVSPDVNGMLGGYPHVSRIDLQGSRNFINKIRRLLSPPGSTSDTSKRKIPLAVDCGAGIGRITGGLLLDVCDVVDVVEPIEKFARTLEAKYRSPAPGDSPSLNDDNNNSDNARRQTRNAAKDNNTSTSSSAPRGQLGTVYITPLEKWRPPPSKHYAYTMIWNQWCLGHLPDAVLTKYLSYSATQLLDQSDPSAFIMVKENLTSDPFGADIYDEVDSSVTRSDAKFRQIFEDAGLDIIRMELQAGGWPKGLYPVKMYALRSKKKRGVEEQEEGSRENKMAKTDENGERD